MGEFIFRQSGGLELLVCEPLEAQGFTNVFTTRSGGVSPLPLAALNLGNYSYDSRANIIENRRRLEEAACLAGRPLLTLSQTHSADVHAILAPGEVNPFIDWNPPSGDAFLTKLPEIFLAIQTADCLPVLIGDVRTGATAAVHAGWRGTVAGIVTRTVEKMQKCLGTKPGDLMVALGPAIGSCCFQVGPEVIASFRKNWDHFESLISRPQSDGRANLNLQLANRLQLRGLGVNDSAIFNCHLCTICQNDKFFSYRFEKGAEKPVGRLMGLIGRNETDA